MKKMLSFLVILSVLASCIGTVAFGADAVVTYNDFNNITIDEADKAKWPDITSMITLCGGYTARGVGGKDADDTSLVTHYEKGKYILVRKQFKGVSVLEYNLLKTETSSTISLQRDPGGHSLGLPNFRYNAELYPTTQKYKAGLWYHVAFEMNVDDDTVSNPAKGYYNYYLNGVKLYTGAIPADITNGTASAIRIAGTDGKIAYYDDIKFTSGATYDASTASATLSSAGSAVVDNSNGIVKVTPCNVDEIASKVVASEGATVKGVVDPDSFMTKTSGAVEEGDLLAVLAPDGMTYDYYTISLLQTEPFFRDFTGLNFPEHSTWDKVSGDEYFCAGGTASGIGGKSADDVSGYISTDGDKNGYYHLKLTLYGTSTIEFNTLVTNSNWGYIGITTSNTNIAFPVGGNVFSQAGHCKYNEGEWMHLAYEIDAHNGTYKLYVNGNSAVEGRTANIAEGVKQEFRFYGNNRYYDDFKVYSGAYDNSGYDVSLSSQTAGVKNDSKAVELKDMTTAQYLALFTVSEGGVISGVADAETYLTKNPSDKVEAGDKLAVLAPDGVTYVYYDILPDFSDMALVVDGNVATATVCATGFDVDNALCAILLIARYEDGELVEFVPATISQGYADANSVLYSASLNVSGSSKETIKAFLWDDTNNCTALKPAVVK